MVAINADSVSPIQVPGYHRLGRSGRPPPPAFELADEALTRIVEKVGSHYLPREFNLKELGWDLGWCICNWCSIKQLGSAQLMKARAEQLKQVRRASTELQQLLGLDSIGQWVRNEVAMTFPRDGTVRRTVEWRTDHGSPDPAPSFTAFLNGLARLIEAATHRLQHTSTKPVFLLQRSPLEWLAGAGLVGVFELHYRRRASATKDGPYSRFALAAMKEFGISGAYGARSIERAVTAIKSGKSRRLVK